ncbi:conserved Plasmodium protein, unknown function [Plasmodium ovale curtisi]|uniref:Uncharacterized protein n=1 Tax=Plasmodium ovale curtisi TaxID=864141 RepID=A0A1A8W8E1_PLAOA|nr:conserved Plasmodium protein, unknown function [Plasmodium ovale curtisi]
MHVQEKCTPIKENAAVAATQSPVRQIEQAFGEALKRVFDMNILGGHMQGGSEKEDPEQLKNGAISKDKPRGAEVEDACTTEEKEHIADAKAKAQAAEPEAQAAEPGAQAAEPGAQDAKPEAQAAEPEALDAKTIEEKQKKRNSNIKLNTQILQSYIHRSYDKVSTVLIRTSKSFLKKGSINSSESGRNCEGSRNDDDSGGDLGNYPSSGEEKKREKKIKIMHLLKEYSSNTERFDEKFFEEYSEILFEIIMDDDKKDKKKKEYTLCEYKKCIKNKDISKCYEKLKELLDERSLLIKFIVHCKNLNNIYEENLQKITNSYYILTSENEQLNQNNITLKKHIDYLCNTKCTIHETKGETC